MRVLRGEHALTRWWWGCVRDFYVIFWLQLFLHVVAGPRKIVLSTSNSLISWAGQLVLNFSRALAQIFRRLSPFFFPLLRHVKTACLLKRCQCKLIDIFSYQFSQFWHVSRASRVPNNISIQTLLTTHNSSQVRSCCYLSCTLCHDAAFLLFAWLLLVEHIRMHSCSALRLVSFASAAPSQSDTFVSAPSPGNSFTRVYPLT